ncbi:MULTISPECIES: hypothetical protein [Methanobrevibacter]|uniref:hypothetical protein n=1 Tax=Methanobrevibacter TaxID=2172 RepID=UPI0003348513|nr:MULTISPECIES: hypothetical protein [Methanobrevibacter]AGN17322.1 hypothetical protein Abm4_1449 [Methanobrevibacter sp. AbM4]MCI6774776.1 adhesin [Methanobrevibacter boviskoreani]MDY5615093.1 adhesin [Methanobrevibacter boviskoreani]
MKKPDFLNKITWIDIIIIIVIILVACVAVLHISPGTNQEDSSSFDSSTLDKVYQKYIDFYNEGEIVSTDIQGTNASTGENVSISGNVLWCYDDNTKNLLVLVNDSGNTLLAGTYKDNPNAEIYIDQMTLKVDGQKYGNVTEITIAPIEINSFSSLYKGLEKYNNYEVSTIISLNSLDGISLENINNDLFKITKRPSIKMDGNKFQIKVSRSKYEDLKIANQDYKSFSGKTEPIKIRIYNCTDDELNIIKNNYNVTNIKHIN